MIGEALHQSTKASLEVFKAVEGSHDTHSLTLRQFFGESCHVLTETGHPGDTYGSSVRLHPRITSNGLTKDQSNKTKTTEQEMEYERDGI